jgi:hypothetical protein
MITSVYEIRYETPELLDPSSEWQLAVLRATWFERNSVRRAQENGSDVPCSNTSDSHTSDKT